MRFELHVAARQAWGSNLVASFSVARSTRPTYVQLRGIVYCNSRATKPSLALVSRKQNPHNSMLSALDDHVSPFQQCPRCYRGDFGLLGRALLSWCLVAVLNRRYCLRSAAASSSDGQYRFGPRVDWCYRASDFGWARRRHFCVWVGFLQSLVLFGLSLWPTNSGTLLILLQCNHRALNWVPKPLFAGLCLWW